MEFKKNAISGQQSTSQYASVYKQQRRNANINNNLVRTNPSTQLNDINNYFQQNAMKTPSQTRENIAHVTPLTGNDDISKYFQQSRAVQKGPTELHKNYFNQGKNEFGMPNIYGSPNYDDFNQNITTTTTTETIGNVPGGLSTSYSTPNIFNLRARGQNAKVTPINTYNNVKQTTTTTTKTNMKGNLDNKDLLDIFGTSDVPNLKQVTTTTETKGLDQYGKNEVKTTVTKEEFINMKDLPEVFGSSNIQNFKKITTTTTTETTGKGDSKGQTGNNEVKTTITKEEFINMKDLPEVFGSSDIPKYKKVTTTTTETKGKGDSKGQSGNNEVKTTITKEEFINMKDLPEVFGSSDIQNLKKITTTTITETKGKGDSKDQTGVKTTITKEEFINMKDLPEVFGSSNIQNFKKITTTSTPEAKGNVDSKAQTDKNFSLDNFLPQTKTTVTKEEFINMKDLPEVFGSSDIPKYKKITTTTTTETTGKGDSKDQTGKNGVKTTITKEEFINMKDLPEVFGSSNIQNFKKVTTTTTTETTGKGDSKGQNGNNEVKTTITKEEFINMKDLPEVFGSSNIQNFKKITTTTTTETTGKGDSKDQTGVKTTITKEEFINMKDLPEVFGSSNIQNFKKITTTTKTEKTGNVDTTGIVPSTNDILEQTKNITTTTTKTIDNSPIDLKQFGIEQNTETNPITDIDKYLKQFEAQSSQPIDLKQFGLEGNSSPASNVKQTTTTTTTTKIGGNSADNYYYNNDYTYQTSTDKVNETNKNQFDLKQFGIEENNNSSYYGTTGTTGLNDYNFKQTTTTNTTTTETTGTDQFDLKQFGIDQNKSSSSYNFNEFNYKTDKQSSSGIDLSQYGITGEINTTPTSGNQDYSQYFKETKTTTTTTTGNSPVEFNQYGVDLNSFSSNTGDFDLKALGLDNAQQKTTTTTTVTKTGNIDNPSLGGFDFQSLGLDNAGTTQNMEGNFNAYTTSGTKTTTTKVTTSSYAGSTQSNTNQYNYEWPTTTSTTETKTTYSEFQPGTTF